MRDMIYLSFVLSNSSCTLAEINDTRKEEFVLLCDKDLLSRRTEVGIERGGIHSRKRDGVCTFYHKYLANLTQRIRHKESQIFTIFVPVLKTLCIVGLKIL